MRRFLAPVTRLTVLLLALPLGGCSTPQSRIERHPALFDALPAEQQTLVRAGQIAIGMPEDAVRLALGEPDRISRRTDADGVTTVWRYTDGGGEQPVVGFPAYGAYGAWGRPFGLGGAGWFAPGVPGAVIVTPHVGRERERLRVSLVDGRVTAIEEVVR